MQKNFNHYFHLMAKPSSFHCNIKCEYCFYLEKEKLFPQRQQQPYKKQYMSDRVLENYVRQYIAANQQQDVIFAWQGGEPTLLGVNFYRKAVELQKKYANGKSIFNSFQTNGIMLNHEWCQFFAENQFLIGISIDGLETAHNAYRVFNNNAPTFEKVHKAMNLLIEHHVEFNTLTVVNDKNWHLGTETYLALKSLGSQYMQFIPIVEPLPGKDGEVSAFSVPPHGYGQFLLDIFNHWATTDVGDIFINEFDALLGQWMGYPSNSCIHTQHCGNAMIIEANGDIYACDHFVYPQYFIGNLLSQSLSDIVKQEKQYQFGQDKEDTLTSICRRCDVRYFCHGGCPKDRIIAKEGELHRHNYLCASYQLFYRGTTSIMEKMQKALRTGYQASEWQRF